MQIRIFFAAAVAVVATAGCGGIVTENERDKDPAVDYEWAAWPMPNPANAGLPNPASYEIQGNTVKDNVTGLVWQRNIPAQKYTWENAKAYCSSLSVDGLSDWRLPSVIELVSIVDFTRMKPAIDTVSFPGTPNSDFWSSSVDVVPWEPSGVYAWNVGFIAGGTRQNAGQDQKAVRCVRGDVPLPAEHYTIGAGVVTDNATKLQWQRALGSAQMTLTQATAYCQELQLDGTGWRLPSIHELQTIVDRRAVDPCIDTSKFWQTPDVNTVWSSSVILDDPATNPHGPAWGVDFHFSGMTVMGSDLPDYAVRCVR